VLMSVSIGRSGSFPTSTAQVARPGRLAACACVRCEGLLHATNYTVSALATMLRVQYSMRGVEDLRPGILWSEMPTRTVWGTLLVIGGVDMTGSEAFKRLRYPSIVVCRSKHLYQYRIRLCTTSAKRLRITGDLCEIRGPTS
jgi:hypothetical protein